MVETSLVFLCLRKLVFFYNASFCKKIIDRIVTFALYFWDRSFTKKMLFRNYGFQKAIDNSVVVRLFSKLRFLSINLSRSKIIYELQNLAQNAIYMRIPLVKRSLAQLLNHSAIAKLICGYFGVTFEEKAVEGNPVTICVLLVVFVAVGIFSGPLYGIVAFVGFAGFVLTMNKTQTAIFAAAFLIPVIPTKIAMALAALTIFSYLVKLFITGKATLSFNITDFFVSAYALLLIYSVFISFIPSNSAVMVSTYVLFILFYFAVKNTIKTKKQLFTVVSLMVLSGFFVGLLGIYQQFTGFNINIDNNWIDTSMFDDGTIRVFSTWGNPNVLGEFLLLMIPLAFAGVYYFKNLFYKLLSLCFVLVMVICMVFTLSRGAWLGLIVGFGFFALLRDARLVAIGIIGLLFAPIALPESIIHRFSSIGNMVDSSTNYRVSIWMASTRMLADFWPIGIGLGTSVFILIFQRYAFSASYALHSHNLFLQILIDLGIFGFIAFLGFMLSFFKANLNQNSSQSNFIKTLSAALIAGMVGFLLQGMTDNTWYNYRMVNLFWFIMALSGCLASLKEMSPQIGEDLREETQ